MRCYYELQKWSAKISNEFHVEWQNFQRKSMKELKSLCDRNEKLSEIHTRSYITQTQTDTDKR